MNPRYKNTVRFLGVMVGFSFGNFLLLPTQLTGGLFALEVVLLFCCTICLSLASIKKDFSEEERQEAIARYKGRHNTKEEPH